MASRCWARLGAALVGLCLLGSLQTLQAKEARWFIWDDNGSNAKSGVEGDLQDPGNTDGKSGVKTPPQTYFIPPQRQFEDVDPEDLAENRRRDYSPYALAQFASSVQYGQQSIPKGYYHIKIGGARDGSPAINQQTLQVVNPQMPALWPPQGGKPPKEAPQVFVLKRLGKVVAVLPIHHIDPYQPPKGEKPPKNPVARLEVEHQTPRLKVYWGKVVYSTDFDAPQP